MPAQDLPQSTPGVPASRARAHVVYDRTTGVIRHVHHTVQFEGGAPQAEAPEDRARRLAGGGPEVDVVEVDPTEVNHHRPVRIDPATRTVVPLQDGG